MKLVNRLNNIIGGETTPAVKKASVITPNKKEVAKFKEDNYVSPRNQAYGKAMKSAYDKKYK